MKQIIDLNFKKVGDKYTPAVKIFDGSKVQSIEIQDQVLTWKLSDYDKCIGYFDGEDYVPCKNNEIIEGKFERCKYCDDKQGFRAAFLFGQAPNERMKEYLAEEHFVYLAFFEPDIVKVGTAHHKRQFKRLVEQDSKYFMYVAKNNGFKIQDLEHSISKELGLTEMVKTKQKIEGFSLDTPEEKVREKLFDTYKKIISSPTLADFNNWYMDESEIRFYKTEDFYKKYYTPKDIHEVKNFDFVSGKVLGLRGKMLILENEVNEVLLSKKKIIGREIVDESFKSTYEIPKVEQIGMF